MQRFNPENFNDFTQEEINSSILFRDSLPGKSGKLQAQIDIIIESNLTQNQSIELFNYDNSISHTANLGITTLTPFDLYELKRLIDAFDVCEPDLVINYIFFDRFGNLIFQPRPNEYVKISCRQCSYKSLLLSSQKNIFRIEKTRMVFSDSAQIDNEITKTRKTFLGLAETNKITPRTYFRPNQYQSLIVDMPEKIDIDGEKGLVYTINSGLNSRMSFSFYISRYFKQTF